MSAEHEDLAAELARGFRAEAAEYVAQLNRGLLELETGADESRREELLTTLRRHAHTLKGSAGFTPYREIVERAHEVENLLGSIAESHDRGAFNAIYDHLDAVLRVFDAGPSAADAAEAAPLEESVRVPTRKLNALMSLIGEILVARVRGDERLAEFRELRQRIGDLAGAIGQTNGKRSAAEGAVTEPLIRELQRGAAQMQRDLERDSMHMAILTGNLQEEIKRVRMQPVGVVFETFRRTVRDLAVRASKEVNLATEGDDTEVDKKILEELREPLLHLIRNAIDHGLESTADRVAAGKPASGRISLRASTNGHTMTLDVADDGRGLDYAAIRRTAAEKRLLDADRIEAATDDELLELVFGAGFSTRAAVGELSGRGIGLDAVRDTVRRLQGEIRVKSSAGRGTTFTMTVPLTLSTSRGLLLRSAGGTYALPFASIERIVRIAPHEISDVDGHEAVRVDDRAVGLLRLRDFLQGDGSAGSELPEKIPVIVLKRGSERIAVAADVLLSEQEMVVKSLGHHLRRIRGIAGAAILGSGSIVTVLNPSDLFELRGRQRDHGSAAAAGHEQERPKARILVVDDSVTTRTLERTILRTAGYSVRTARDGVEALQLLEESPDDAVITDVEMPRMNGIELLRAIRRHESLRDVPVVLLTSLGADADRRAGLDHGANAYLVKTQFEQTEFLRTVESVVGS